ncbi:MAG: hypothetical protein HYX50_03565 [Chloroflexi bacterium]|nr:hypothetical protein [Chloroflexota bacterium]
MRTFGSEARPSDADAHGPRPQTLADAFSTATATLAQDSSEYGFIGFVGAAGAFMLALILRLMRNSVTDSLIAPATLVLAAGTFTVASVAYLRAMRNLHPGAADAALAAAARGVAPLRPWVPPATLLLIATFALSLFGSKLGGAWPQFGAGLLLIAATFWMLIPRSFYPASLETQPGTAAQAEGISALLARRVTSRLMPAWLVVLAPGFAAGFIALASGFGPASTGLAAFFIVAPMPLAAGVMTLLFLQAAEAAQAAR